ncbi:SsrA-binding protein SmpB [Tepidiforma sp.]|uniref:SsrA-binding protein SmpB n=1 Tax=Tepidiforma sp. TaxID=2682230 RepID=UPI002ADD8E47|nr:SsrA-binding protein SmpB [Tepidiforma sp.]
MSDTTIVQNRRARHDYEILSRFEAGIALTGSEVKSARDHKVQLQGAYARVKDGEVWLLGAHIAPYANAGYATHDPTRDRKLLLHKKEIRRIAQMVEQRGLTLIPLSMYFKRGKVKVELGMGRGLKRYDKREVVKKRDQQRALEEALRRRG